MKPILNITWGKAFGEIYCHHATLHIPFQNDTLFSPEIIRIGVTIRANVIEKGEVVGKSDKTIYNYLPCRCSDGMLVVPLNSTPIIEGISLNSWTSLKGGERGTHKEFPIAVVYQIGDEDEIAMPFNHEKAESPYILSESKFANLQDGDKIDVSINFN